LLMCELRVTLLMCELRVTLLMCELRVALHSPTKIFVCALVFRPVAGVIWGADSEHCIGQTASAVVA